MEHRGNWRNHHSRTPDDAGALKGGVSFNVQFESNPPFSRPGMGVWVACSSRYWCGLITL